MRNSKPRLVLAMSAAIATALLMAVPAAADYKWIKSETQFREHVVGKRMVHETGWSIVKRDGSITGKFKQGKFQGKWVWSGKYFCRNGIVGKVELGTDCQKVELDGESVRLTREKGKGKGTTWKLQ